MNSYLLPSLEIENFRAFKHLRIDHLARVNLIVGKNNVGKSSVLDALWLYARRGAPGVIWEQLAFREESAVRNNFSDADPSLSAIRNLFHQRPNVLVEGGILSIGPADLSKGRLSIAIEHHGAKRIQMGPVPFFVLRMGDRIYLSTEIMHGLHDISYLPGQEQIPHTVVAASGLTPSYVTALWERIALTDLEDQVINALRIIEPKIERVNILSSPETGSQRIAMMRIRGVDQPIPLKSYGGGMYRLFAIAVAAVNARQGLLLIDEIENGLHYTVQKEIWRWIFELAEQLELQVFASTHSRDCLEAFQRIARAHSAEGQVVRLGHKKGGVITTLFNERELKIAVEQNVEVR